MEGCAAYCKAKTALRQFCLHLVLTSSIRARECILVVQATGRASRLYGHVMFHPRPSPTFPSPAQLNARNNGPELGCAPAYVHAHARMLPVITLERNVRFERRSRHLMEQAMRVPLTSITHFESLRQMGPFLVDGHNIIYNSNIRECAYVKYNILCKG